MNSCPIICGENDIVCKGGVDSNGCKMADSCVYAGTVWISKNYEYDVNWLSCIINFLDLILVW